MSRRAKRGIGKSAATLLAALAGGRQPAGSILSLPPPMPSG